MSVRKYTDTFMDTLNAKLSAKDVLQKKYIKNINLSQEEMDDLEDILHFFIEINEENKCTIEDIVESYLFINKMIWEETYYFKLNGRYRYSTFEEVDGIVYSSREYMKKYMLGLTISEYIWLNHINMIRYFKNKLDLLKGSRYLEIGPGFGQYLVKAVLKGNFEQYYACDISKTSVETSNEYLKYKNIDAKCVVEHKNFFDYNSKEKFDCIVMGEVLEHVENPQEMLAKIWELLNENGKAFVTTVINAPVIDHIFLFDSIDAVLKMVESVKFKIAEYTCFTEGDIILEKAIKKKMAINIAMLLEK